MEFAMIDVGGKQVDLIDKDEHIMRRRQE